MSYGTPEWQDWVLPEEEGLKHIKASQLVIYTIRPNCSYQTAYDAGVNTVDTANVGFKLNEMEYD